MRSTVRRWIPGINRALLVQGKRSVRGLAITASLAIAAVPALMLASPAQAGTHHQVSAHVGLPHVKHHQSADSGPNVHHDTSLPLRVLAARAHHAKVARHRIAPDEQLVLPHPPASNVPDPVLQARTGTKAAISTLANFDGISVTSAGNSCGCAPPDPNAAVGTTQVVEIVNTAFAVYSKTGATIMAPTATNTLFSGFGGNCQATNDGDATVAFDKLASRWVFQQFANVRSASGPYLECVAVSTSADATGTYNRYSFQFTDFPDYPKLSTWPDAYYTTYNMFTPGGGSFVDGEICAMDRASMLTGAAATQQCFTTDSSHGGILAADVDGSTPPPAGEPETVMGIGTTSTTLDYWHFHVDFTTPANSTFTGPTDLAVASYSTACGGGTCIPQGGTTQLLDSLGDRIMYRLAYRNFGDHESLVVDHSVTAGSSVGVRWYEFRLSGGNPTVFQQGTYAPDSTYRWMGSIAMDHVGNIALGYSQSSSTTSPSIAFTGRAAGDPLGTMTQAETTVFTGGGSQTGGLSRWGDYTSMQVDPSDDCTFWYTDEYIPSSGSFNWNTRLASFQLPGCANPNDFTISDNPSSGTVNPPGGSTTSTISISETGTPQTVNLSATGLPAGASAAFNPSSLSASGASTMTISTSASTPAGSYPITVTGTGTTATHSTTFTLIVGSDFTISASPSSGSVNPGGSSTSTISISEIGAPQTVNLSATGLPAGASAAFNPSSLSGSGTSTMTISTSSSTPTGTCSVTVTGTGTVTHSTTYTLTVNPVSNGITNGGFEAGTFSGWTTSGAATSIVSSGQHSGSFAAQAGLSTPTNGDSNIAQAFIVPAGNNTLTFWYNVTCPDSVTFDWATATLTNNTTNTTTTILPQTCVASSGWTEVTASVIAGDTYTLTLTSHDDNFATDPTFTLFDDVGLSAGPNIVTVNNPGNQSTPRRTQVSLQMAATDSQAGQTFTWSATGLPSGLSINSSTGLISGTTARHTGTFSVTVTATDTTGAQGSTSFTWTIT